MQNSSSLWEQVRINWLPTMGQPFDGLRQIRYDPWQRPKWQCVKFEPRLACLDGLSNWEKTLKATCQTLVVQEGHPNSAAMQKPRASVDETTDNSQVIGCARPYNWPTRRTITDAIWSLFLLVFFSSLDSLRLTRGPFINLCFVLKVLHFSCQCCSKKRITRATKGNTVRRSHELLGISVINRPCLQCFPVELFCFTVFF